MTRWLQAVAGAALVLAASLAPTSWRPAAAADDGAFAFNLTSVEGEPMPLAAWRHRPLLIVNSASFCGFTYQYDALQAVWERFRDRGLVVLAVPSGDFAGQEYGTDGEIKTFCETRFDLDFPLAGKVHVKGPAADPLFAWLGRELGAPRWNFTKYLIGADGRPLQSWPSSVEPTAAEIIRAIEAALAAAAPPPGSLGDPAGPKAS